MNWTKTGGRKQVGRKQVGQKVGNHIFFKIRVEICQFTKIAKTDLNVHFMQMNSLLGVHHGNQTTPTRQLLADYLHRTTPTRTTPTGQLTPDNSHKTTPIQRAPTGQLSHLDISHPGQFSP